LGNQGSLREDAHLFAQTQRARDLAGTDLTGHQGVDGDHGRIKTRTATVFDCLQQHPAWAGLKSVVMHQHRAVENSLHRVPDMVFRGDASRVRTASAPDNFTTPKHMALKLRRASDRLSIQGSPQGRRMG